MSSTLLMLVVLGGMMFFMTRSQKKQQQKRQDLLNSMTVGSKVVTIGGLHGVISEIDQTKDTVWLDCEGIQLEFNRSAIATVTETPAADVVTETVTETTVETPTTDEVVEAVEVEIEEPNNK
ncbi:preprotein translocase subunit YajC [Vagococcus coleopterorum]|uniref:Preprotein translocase subunit YajC n=1 Tax=Vagococcus coleopterorum TaxID=2714946 RepID=A0A6G8ALQ5_9ENTE|nr:preprotein translocase subunit YajC [Vagococcus coleopterorum]QIL45892.1 preprotein translocase subunit YajC [Vagococcus coleopterorum]